MSSTTIKPRRRKATKQFAAKAITDEIGRRSKPKAGRGKAKSWVFSALGAADLAAILDGGVVTVTFGSGRVEHVGLKVSA